MGCFPFVNDLRAPSFAPLRIDLKAPFCLLDGFGVLGLGTGLLMTVGSLDLISFLIEGSTPNVDGVACSTLIFFVDGGSVLILGVAPPGAG